ncbi:MAG TPA: porin [Caulobacteraceae bacterium]|jgi:hypothetical protein|nr:porin [Caulobacteraceae bacterium]
MKNRATAFAVAVAAVTLGSATAALAEDAKAPEAPKAWADTIKASGWIDAGVTFNTKDAPSGVNFGHLFTDKTNKLLLNQLGVTIERPIDSKATDVDFGFRFQGMYGSDARYTHFLNLFDKSKETGQFDIVEANVQAHLPVLTPGGVDVKAGSYVTLEGFEVIPGTGNTFYSKSYVFNFGIPLKHTGVMTVTHVNPMFDLYLGVDAGVNTLPGHKDNNGAAGFHGGFGINTDKVTILATTHIGPENPRGTPGIRPNHDLRYLNDVVITWKVSDKLTAVTDANYIKDDAFKASGGGVAQYLIYAVNPQLSLSGRAEVWADPDGFFVCGFPGNQDFANLQKGLPNSSFCGGSTTYGELTFGATYKPVTTGPLTGVMLRPELRFDSSLNGTKPYADGTKKGQVTLGFDVVVPFG